MLTIWYVTYAKSQDINNYLTLFTQNLKIDTDTAQTHLTDISKVFFDTSINRADVRKIMMQASHTQDTKTLALLRTKLLQKLTPTYKEMKTYHIEQLHFHLPNAISFLRFNRVKKYGDSLTKVRETLEYVNKTRIPISVFEEGRIFSGFRNVYPLYYKNVFVGTVETSFSFNAMQTNLTKIDSSSYLFMLKRQVVEQKVFKDERFRYKASEFSNYSYDKETLFDTMQMRLKKLFLLNKAISKSVKTRLQKSEMFSIHHSEPNIYKDIPIIITFIPVKNLNDATVAYIIHYQFGDYLTIIIHKSKQLLLILSALVVALSFLLFMYLCYEEKKQNKLHEFATHDALTQIYNRHAINETLKFKIQEHQRYTTPLSIIFFDIDYFKKVNDTYGHDMGDYVLKNIAQIVQSQLRSSDIFARWGGEEFIIFLPNTSLSDATNLAQKLRVSIQKHAFNSIETITCSFGVTQLIEEDDKISLLKRVDNYLYKAKESGRNCVVSDIKT